LKLHSCLVSASGEAAASTHTEQLLVSFPPWTEHTRIRTQRQLFLPPCTTPSHVQQQVTVCPLKTRIACGQCLRRQAQRCPAALRQLTLCDGCSWRSAAKTWPWVRSATGAREPTCEFRPTLQVSSCEGGKAGLVRPGVPAARSPRQGPRTVAAVVCPGAGRVWGRGAVGRDRLKVEHF